MYFDYIKEREDFDAIVKDYGFVTYKIDGKECFIRDIYVKPEFRGSRKGDELITELTARAKDDYCEIITAREYPWVKASTQSMYCAIRNGFELISSNNEFIIIGKRI